MIPMMGLMIWAYGMARLIEIMSRKGERCPRDGVVLFMFVMLLVMSFSCVSLQVGGLSTGMAP